jgi:hypothetical protein
MRFVRVNRLHHYKGRDGDLGVGKSKLFKDIVERPGAGPNIPGTDVPRLKLTKIGEKATATTEAERDRVIEGLRRWSEQAKNKAPRGPRHPDRADATQTR